MKIILAWRLASLNVVTDLKMFVNISQFFQEMTVYRAVTSSVDPVIYSVFWMKESWLNTDIGWSYVWDIDSRKKFAFFNLLVIRHQSGGSHDLRNWFSRAPDFGNKRNQHQPLSKSSSSAGTCFWYVVSKFTILSPNMAQYFPLL